MRHFCQTYFFKGKRVILFNDNYFSEVNVHIISRAIFSYQLYFQWPASETPFNVLAILVFSMSRLFQTTERFSIVLRRDV